MKFAHYCLIFFTLSLVNSALLADDIKVTNTKSFPVWIILTRRPALPDEVSSRPGLCFCNGRACGGSVLTEKLNPGVSVNIHSMCNNPGVERGKSMAELLLNHAFVEGSALVGRGHRHAWQRDNRINPTIHQVSPNNFEIR